MKKYRLKSNKEFTNMEKLEIFDYLYKLIKEYIDYVNSDKFHPDNDFEHYFYEEAVDRIAGKDFWRFYNSKV